MAKFLKTPGFRTVTVTATCGHKSHLEVSTAPALRQVVDRMITSDANRPCIHCRAGFPERGQN